MSAAHYSRKYAQRFTMGKTVSSQFALRHYIWAGFACASLAGGSAFAEPITSGPQASLNLNDSGLGFCNVANTASWSASKDGALNGQAVDWTVNVTKTAIDPVTKKITADGYVRITNSGQGPALIDAIVANLQRRQSNKWITASSDVATSTNGDAATTAKNCAGASSEGLSQFTENSASGPIIFTDALSNDVWSITNAIIAPGATVNLLWSATFDNSALQIPAGEQIRMEFIITFGNAGGRGGSGAVCTNLDVNVDGAISDAEKFVRSVPSRTTLPLSGQINATDTVTLTDQDANVVVSGGLTKSNFSTNIGGGTGVEQLTSSGTRNVGVSVAGAGSVTNCASVSAPPVTIPVNGPIDPLTGQPKYSYIFTCAPGVDLQACKKVDVSCTNCGFENGDFYTYTQGGWGAKPAGNNPGALLANNFAALYPSGLAIGGNYTMSFTSAAAVEAYLPAGGTAGALTQSLVNPVSTSAGVFGGQVTALRLNVNFSQAAITPTGFGGLKITNYDPAVDGKTVSQVLAIDENLLGGGAPSGYCIIAGVPSGCSGPKLNDLTDLLNKSFDNGVVSGWATTHLTP